MEVAVLCIKLTEFASNFLSNQTESIDERRVGKSENKNSGNKSNNILFDDIRMKSNRGTFFPFLLVKKKNFFSVNQHRQPITENGFFKNRNTDDTIPVHSAIMNIDLLLLERTCRLDNFGHFTKDTSSSCFSFENVLRGIKKYFLNGNLLTVRDTNSAHTKSKTLNENQRNGKAQTINKFVDHNHKTKMCSSIFSATDQSTTLCILNNCSVGETGKRGSVYTLSERELEEEEEDEEEDKMIKEREREREREEREGGKGKKSPRRAATSCLVRHIHTHSHGYGYGHSSCLTDAISSLDQSLSALAHATSGWCAGLDII